MSVSARRAMLLMLFPCQRFEHDKHAYFLDSELAYPYEVLQHRLNKYLVVNCVDCGSEYASRVFLSEQPEHLCEGTIAVVW